MKKVVLFFILSFFVYETKSTANYSFKYYDNKLVEYRYTKYLDSAIYYFNKSLYLALKQNDSVSVFYLYKHLGDAYEHHGFIDSTFRMYNICEKYIPVSNFRLKAFLLHDKAYTYSLLYNYDKAAELTLQALKLAKKIGRQT